MKTNSFILGAAALMLATSCSNDEVVQVAENSAAIGFSSFVNNSTRTDYGTKDSQLTSLKVYGVSDGTGSGTFKLFEGQEVTNSAGSWTYSPLKYWIAGNTYTFAAVAPTDAIADAVSAGKVKVNQGTDLTNGGVTSLEFMNNGNVDLLWDAPAVLTNVATSQGAVQLNLRHLLTRIRFQFLNNTKADENFTIKVSDVKITNSVNQATWTPGSGWAPATGDNVNGTFTFAMAEEYKAAAEKAISGTQNLIPEGTAKEYAVNFTITLVEKIGDKDVTRGIYEHNITISGTNFEAGNSYTLSANVDMTNVNPEEQINPITFEVKVVDWAEQTPDTEVNLPKSDKK